MNKIVKPARETSGTKNKSLLKPLILLIAMSGLSLAGCAIDAGIGEVREPAQVKKAEFMLTFDDGPTPDFTGRVLDALAGLQANDGTPVIAGFFLVADAPESFWQRRYHYAPYELWTRKGSLTKYPDIARRIQMAGHVIGNHSTHHAWFFWPWLNTQEAVLAELTRWEEIAAPIIGAPAERLFRPPYFTNTATVREIAQRQGYQVVMGESAGDASPFASLAMIRNRTAAILASWDKPYPCVLVFHDIRPATHEHLAEIVANLQQHGYQLVHFDPARL